MKRLFAALMSVALLFTLTACSDDGTVQTAISDEVYQVRDIPLSEALPLDFIFSSGVGAWQTMLTLNSDGSFVGIFSDAEIGEAADDYPFGTTYISFFHGAFDEIRQIDEYTYSLTLTSLVVDREAGSEWIEEGLRYVAAEPYGLSGCEEFVIYSPLTPVSDLPEDFISWWPYRTEQRSILSCWGLCNTVDGYGFFTYE